MSQGAKLKTFYPESAPEKFNNRELDCSLSPLKKTLLGGKVQLVALQVKRSNLHTNLLKNIEQ